MRLLSQLSIVLALAATLLVVSSMLRQPALRRLGLRNFGRRKWNTVLVILGSMVGTALIAGSLVLNDSTGRFQYNQAMSTLGEIDEVAQLSGQRSPGDQRPIPLFERSVLSAVTPQAVADRAYLLREERVQVDGILPAIVQEMPAEALSAAGDKVALASPAATVIGVDWKSLRAFGGEPLSVALQPAPGPDRVYVNDRLGKALDLKSGSRIRLRGTAPRTFTVAGVLPSQGITGFT
ncbi:MAG: ABC transporter permease, partial [Chloroflexota bacterium]|nr:ABC transporter permease [Chloroflexota bacterium]